MFKRSDLVSEDVKAVTNAQKAQILMNALPYIKKYNGKIEKRAARCAEQSAPENGGKLKWLIMI